MISRSTQRGLLLASLLAAASFLIVRGGGEEDVGPIEGLDTRLNYALENFEMRAFDEDGAPILRLTAPRLTNEAVTDIGEVEAPRVEIVHEGFLWNIMAESATISDDQEEVLLRGRVRLERAGPTPLDRLEVDTSDVTLIVENRVAHARSPVLLEDASGTLRATGFRIDMNSNEFQLQDDVQARYALPQ